MHQQVSSPPGLLLWRCLYQSGNINLITYFGYDINRKSLSLSTSFSALSLLEGHFTVFVEEVIERITLYPFRR